MVLKAIKRGSSVIITHFTDKDTEVQEVIQIAQGHTAK